MKNNGKHKRQYSHFSFQSSFTNAIDLYAQARNEYLQGLLAKYFVLRAEFPMSSFHFPNGKYFSQFIDNF